MSEEGWADHWLRKLWLRGTLCGHLPGTVACLGGMPPVHMGSEPLLRQGLWKAVSCRPHLQGTGLAVGKG